MSINVDDVLAGIAQLSKHERERLAVALAAKSTPVTPKVRFDVQTLRAASEDPTNKMKIQHMLATARRLKVSIDPTQPIDIVQLDKQLEGKNVQDRMELKSSLFDLRMIQP
jgi:hypothetical protein